MSQTKAQLIDNLVQALSFTSTSSAPTNGVYLSAANQLSFATNTTERLRLDSAGQIEAVSLGSASAPTFSFTTDPNTGIYSPGADQVAISTNGTGRLFVDASGRVGVGTSSPATTLHVAGTATSGSIINALALTQAGTGTGTGTNLYIGYSTTTGTYGSISGFYDGTGTALTFATSPNAGVSAVQERLRIDNAGRVGVGTSSPQAIIHSTPATVNGGLSTAFISTQGGTGTNTGTALRVGYGSTDGAFSEIAGAYENPGTYLDLKTSTNNSTAASTKVRITAAGNVGIGTSAPQVALQIGNYSGNNQLAITSTSASGTGALFFGDGTGADLYRGYIQYYHVNDSLEIGTAATGRLTITSAGNVGIGVTSPSSTLDVNGDCAVANTRAYQVKDSGGTTRYAMYMSGSLSPSAGNDLFIGNTLANSLVLYTNAAERARIDSSGRLLVGTSSARSIGAIGTHQFSLEGVGYNASSIALVNNENTFQPAYLTLGKSRGTSVNSNTIIQNGDGIGVIDFAAADGDDINSRAARISVEIDGTPGNGDTPGRIILATTADGASSPTERMRIASDGSVFIGKTGYALGTAGIELQATGTGYFTRNGALPLAINRLSSDGTMLGIYQDTVEEGRIDVSGSTVSLIGAHLSRWSQLRSGETREEILRGTVLSNIDEMCEWGDEDNEQLNRMKVSDVEGDKNVSGVFQSWDDDDDTYTNDFFCAMTGDFIIRIGAGTTVERGDLLMSAGDGTAKPQDDDIIRSKTIAKVTSTNVSCTYDDGSYCVPCVLMAC